MKRHSDWFPLNIQILKADLVQSLSSFAEEGVIHHFLPGLLERQEEGESCDLLPDFFLHLTLTPGHIHTYGLSGEIAVNMNCILQTFKPIGSVERPSYSKYSIPCVCVHPYGHWSAVQAGADGR